MNSIEYGTQTGCTQNYMDIYNRVTETLATELQGYLQQSYTDIYRATGTFAYSYMNNKYFQTVTGIINIYRQLQEHLHTENFLQTVIDSNFNTYLQGHLYIVTGPFTECLSSLK